MLRHMIRQLAPGDVAPDFSAPVIGGAYKKGATIRLEEFRGRVVVLYFYPKDDTPGCTTQACAIRDHYGRLQKAGAAIFGVSVDSPESHEKFIAKYDLPFPLISDESHQIVQAYGVWIDKNLYGKTMKSTERSTFVINPDGTIKSILRKVKPDEHVDTVLTDLRHFEP